MNTSIITAKSIVFHRDNSMSVYLSDERVITVPLKWYPRLERGKLSQKRNWEICGAGRGIHWPDLDEDLSIAGLLRGEASPEYRNSQNNSSRRNLNKNTQPELRV